MSQTPRKAESSRCRTTSCWPVPPAPAALNSSWPRRYEDLQARKIVGTAVKNSWSPNRITPKGNNRGDSDVTEPALGSLLQSSLRPGPLAQRVEHRTFNPTDRVRALGGPLSQEGYLPFWTGMVPLANNNEPSLATLRGGRCLRHTFIHLFRCPLPPGSNPI